MAADLNQILSAIEGGDPGAAERLLPLVYDELRGVAAARLAREDPGHTLQATALVHEAYLRLVQPQHSTTETVQGLQRFAGRAHFFAAAAEAMRRILVDRARAKHTVKRARPGRRVDLTPETMFSESCAVELLELEDALEALERVDPAKARVVTLRFFGGLTVQEAAAVMEVSVATAERLWSVARAWLYRAMGGGEDPGSGES